MKFVWWFGFFELLGLLALLLICEWPYTNWRNFLLPVLGLAAVLAWCGLKEEVEDC